MRALKRKLDELIPTLPNAAPSPPQRDEDVPSPGPDEDLDLPTVVEINDGDDDSKFTMLEVNKCTNIYKLLYNLKTLSSL